MTADILDTIQVKDMVFNGVREHKPDYDLVNACKFEFLCFIFLVKIIV